MLLNAGKEGKYGTEMKYNEAIIVHNNWWNVQPHGSLGYNFPLHFLFLTKHLTPPHIYNEAALLC